jgi:NADPH:quinone reductase-like Zn-dependent oxidoreductase
LPEARWILIYGGSSSVGLFAIQLAKLAGLKVITVCSTRNFELVRQYGADAVVDYRDVKAAVEEIKEVTESSLTLAFDCITEAESASICVEAMVGEGDRRIVFSRPSSDAAVQLAEERGIKWDRVMAFTLLGHVSQRILLAIDR